MQEQNKEIELVNKEVKLIYDRVLIKPEGEEKTKGGIFIPAQAKEKPCIGLVVATGKGRRDDRTGLLLPMMSKVGDTVLYNREHGLDIKLSTGDYLMINDFEVLGVVRDDD